MSEDILAVLEQQKLDAMKELAYGASHEINNPLANIAARAQNLLRDEAAPERRRSLEMIHQQAMRAHEMIADLMLFARPPQLQFEPVDLCELAQTIGTAAEDEFARHDIRLVLHLSGVDCHVEADAQQLQVALGALLRNSQEAIGAGGTIEITVRENADSEDFSIEVLDTGAGISPEVRKHLFDPFYSGREAGRGLGFGLSKCWRIVTDHGGTLEVDDAISAGARFTMRLPARQNSA